MKHFLLLAGFLLSAFLGMAQSPAVIITAAGTPPTTPNPNVIFSIQSGTQGIQIPMMSTIARISMGSSSFGSSPAPGVLLGVVVFDTTTKSIWYNNGATWINVDAATTGWLTTGNAGTVDGISFIGTTDNTPLNFKVNNQQAGRIDPTLGNTYFGYQAGLSSSNGINLGNSAFGDGALEVNTTGEGNTANGSGALSSNTSGGLNTAIGVFALTSNTTGQNNTAVGDASLRNNVTGSELSAFGTAAEVAVDGLQDATAIGSGSAVSSSFTIQLGDQQVTAVNSFGTFNTISDGRFKFNIREDVSGLDFILKLRPVTYQLDTRKIQASLASGNRLASYTNTTDNDLPSMHLRRTGFIAQEVEKAADSTGFDFDGVKKPQNDKDHYSLSYEEFVVPLVKAVQEQQKEIKDQQKEIEEQRKEIEDLKKMVTELSKK